MNLRISGKAVAILITALVISAIILFTVVQFRVWRNHEEADLLTYVPSDCVALLETDCLSADSLSQSLQTDDRLAGMLLHRIAAGSSIPTTAHGLRITPFMVSFHDRLSAGKAVFYFRGAEAGRAFLQQVLACREVEYIPKEAVYRGEKIVIYPLGDCRFFCTYSGPGFWIASEHMHLIEAVIDARSDGRSLSRDSAFQRVYQRKAVGFLSIYTSAPLIPLLYDAAAGQRWSDCRIYCNTDALYMMGTVQVSGPDRPFLLHLPDTISQHAAADSILLVHGSAGIDSCISAVRALPSLTPFQQSVSALSAEASLALVADMEEVARHPRRYAACLPAFLSEHAGLFTSFILSVQLTGSGDSLSYILTLKPKS